MQTELGKCARDGQRSFSNIESLPIYNIMTYSRHKTFLMSLKSNKTRKTFQIAHLLRYSSIHQFAEPVIKPLTCKPNKCAKCAKNSYCKNDILSSFCIGNTHSMVILSTAFCPVCKFTGTKNCTKHQRRCAVADCQTFDCSRQIKPNHEITSVVQMKHF